MNIKDSADSKLQTAYMSKNELYMKQMEAAAVEVKHRFNMNVKKRPKLHRKSTDNVLQFLFIFLAHRTSYVII